MALIRSSSESSGGGGAKQTAFAYLTSVPASVNLGFEPKILYAMINTTYTNAIRTIIFDVDNSKVYYSEGNAKYNVLSEVSPSNPKSYGGFTITSSGFELSIYDRTTQLQYFAST